MTGGESHFIIEHLGKLVGVLIIALLGLLKFIPSRKQQAETAVLAIKDRPVSHVELVECQMNVKDTIVEEFKQLRKEWKKDLRHIYGEINKKEDKKGV